MFDGTSAIDICLKHVTSTPAPLDGVHEPLAAVILRALAKAPEDRFASASDFAAALRAADPRDWDVAAARAWWQRVKALDDPNGVVREPTTPLTLSVGVRA